MKDHQVIRCIRTLADWYGMEIDFQVMKDLLETDSAVVSILDEWYPDPGEGLDTQDRDDLCDLIARDCGLPRWPLGMDPKEDMQKLLLRLHEKGWVSS